MCWKKFHLVLILIKPYCVFPSSCNFQLQQHQPCAPIRGQNTIWLVGQMLQELGKKHNTNTFLCMLPVLGNGDQPLGYCLYLLHYPIFPNHALWFYEPVWLCAGSNPDGTVLIRMKEPSSEIGHTHPTFTYSPVHMCWCLHTRFGGVSTVHSYTYVHHYTCESLTTVTSGIDAFCPTTTNYVDVGTPCGAE